MPTNTKKVLSRIHSSQEWDEKGHASGHGDDAPIRCPVYISENLKTQLQEINEEYAWGLGLPADDYFTLPRFESEYKKLCRLEEETKNNKRKLLLKQYKLALLKSYRKFLLITGDPVAAEDKKEESAWQKFFKHVRYYFLLVTGMIIDGVGSFLGSEEIMSVIPSISNIGVVIISSTLSFINAALFYSFEAAMLKQSMGLDTLDNFGHIIAADEEEMELTKDINHIMSKTAVNTLSRKDFMANAKLTETLNQGVMDKKRFFDKGPPKKLLFTLLRHLVTGVGAIMVACNGFFMLKALLLSLAPAVLASPAGPIIIGIGIITMLSYFIAMRGQAMTALLSPGSQKFKEVKVKFDQFEPESKASLKQAYDDRRALTNLEHARAEIENERQEVLKLKHQYIGLNKELLENHLKFRKPPQSPDPSANSSSLLQYSRDLWRRPPSFADKVGILPALKDGDSYIDRNHKSA